MLLQYLVSKGYQLKKKTAREFSTSCPRCGGVDRLQIFIVENSFSTKNRGGCGRYWCRQCGISGDYYSWLIDIEGRNPRDVLPTGPTGRKVAVEQKTNNRLERYDWSLFQSFAARVARAAEGHAGDPDSLAFFSSRGLTAATLERLGFGWVPADIFFPARETGRRDGRKTCVPGGACLPVRDAAGAVQTLLIRRADEGQWEQWGKWCQIGRQDVAWLHGEKGLPLVLCESILDAASVIQSYSFREIAAAALLGASKMPDERCMEYLRSASHVLICADGDAGGRTLVRNVLKIREDVQIWRPVGEGIKDVNDILVRHGEDALCLWVDMGLGQAMSPSEDAF